MSVIFNVGDCVQLKHGNSPKMTINEVSPNQIQNITEIQCTWFDEKNVLQYRTFNSELLKPCTKELTEEEEIEGVKPWRQFIKEKNEKNS